jgi:Sulfotransferase family
MQLGIIAGQLVARTRLVGKHALDCDSGMISLQKRFLFVHIPKTAGNSIQSVLRDYSEDQLVALRKEQDGIERFGLRNPEYKVKKHSTLSEYHDALGDEQFGKLYKFTCVRNPWDRMVSYYFTPTQNPETWERKKFRAIISKAVSAADYLRLGNGEEDPFANVDYIMRFENLVDDFRAVCTAISISPPTLPQYNRSSREHYSKYYDDELREFVRARFASEIERFDYSFEER